MIKILHIITTLDKGGAENCLFKLVSNLKEFKHIVICLNRNGYFFDQLKGIDVEVYCLNLWSYNFVSKILELFWIIKKIKPDLVQTWLYHSDLIGGLVGRIAGVKNIIWSLRNTEIPQKGISNISIIIRSCSVLSYLVPKKVICCGYSVRQKHQSLGYKKDKLIIIENGFEDPYTKCNHNEIRKKARANLLIGRNSFVIGMIGRFDYLKGYDSFIKSLHFLAKKNLSRKLVVVFAGKDLVPNNKVLSKWLNESSNSIEFKLLGERDDIPFVLKSLDLFCLNSRAEGFPNVLAEAMLASIPCIATNVGDVKSILGNCGKIIANNPRSLAEAILSFYSSSTEDLLNYGKLGRERIINKFSLEMMLNSYKKIYEKF